MVCLSLLKALVLDPECKERFVCCRFILSLDFWLVIFVVVASAKSFIHSPTLAMGAPFIHRSWEQRDWYTFWLWDSVFSTARSGKSWRVNPEKKLFETNPGIKGVKENEELRKTGCEGVVLIINKMDAPTLVLSSNSLNLSLFFPIYFPFSCLNFFHFFFILLKTLLLSINWIISRMKLVMIWVIRVADYSVLPMPKGFLGWLNSLLLKPGKFPRAWPSLSLHESKRLSMEIKRERGIIK